MIEMHFWEKKIIPNVNEIYIVKILKFKLIDDNYHSTNIEDVYLYENENED